MHFGYDFYTIKLIRVFFLNKKAMPNPKSDIACPDKINQIEIAAPQLKPVILRLDWLDYAYCSKFREPLVFWFACESIDWADCAKTLYLV